MQPYSGRRARFMEKIGQGAAILAQAPAQIHHHDVEYPYRPDSSFYYFTGLAEPECIAVLNPHSAQPFTLFVRPRDPGAEVWTGRRIGLEGAQTLYGADQSFPLSELKAKLPELLQGSERIYYQADRNLESNQIVMDVLAHFQKRHSRTGHGPLHLESPQAIIQALRLIKDDHELALIKKAIALTCEAHNQARAAAQAGVYEYEIQALIEYIFRKNGCEGPGYPSIVASGANSCILHYIENNCPLQAGDLVLIDAGASYGYYNADITRTFPVSGKFSPEQQAIYELVLTTQQAVIDQIRPGLAFNVLNDTARRVITAGLVDLGLLQGSVDQLLEEHKYRTFYMHGVSHYLGLDVHDAGNYKTSNDQWQTLLPGMVLTVEPGIYIAPDLQEVPEQFRGIGVRIEDDVLVTALGYEVLTSAVPKAVDQISCGTLPTRN